MIQFTDNRLYLKGTCNVTLSAVDGSVVHYQSNKFSTGNITPSTNLNEIRAGLGNPIACMIPSDAGLQVNFEAADFSMYAKAAQLGATLQYVAPKWTCQTVAASGEGLTVDVTNGVPVAGLGLSEAKAIVQEVGAASLIATDGTTYPITAEGVVTGFVATAGKSYKVWYQVQDTNAQVATISTLIDPKVVRFEAQMAVYSNVTAANATGTRVGWLYYIIPCMKLQGEATITGDQANNDTTVISGQAMAYDATVVSATCADCDTSTLGYFVYVPDNGAGSVIGLAVVGGVTEVANSSTAQLPVRFVMADGSLVAPLDYATGFTYALASAPAGTSISNAGVITAGTTDGESDVTTTYTDGTNTFECVSVLKVA